MCKALQGEVHVVAVVAPRSVLWLSVQNSAEGWAHGLGVLVWGCEPYWEGEQKRWWAWQGTGFGSMEDLIGGCKGRRWFGLGLVGGKEAWEHRAGGEEDTKWNNKNGVLQMRQPFTLFRNWLSLLDLLPLVQGLHIHVFIAYGWFWCPWTALHSGLPIFLLSHSWVMWKKKKKLNGVLDFTD